MNKYTTDNMGMVYKNSLLITDGEVVGDIKQMQSQIEQLTKENQELKQSLTDTFFKLEGIKTHAKLAADEINFDESNINQQIDDLIDRKIND